MKANRKFKEDEEAVSAVIGVILMVAITVAIAATVYVYVSGMMGSPSTEAENASCVVRTDNGRIKITLTTGGSNMPSLGYSFANSITIRVNGTEIADVFAGNTAFEVGESLYIGNGPTTTVIMDDESSTVPVLPANDYSITITIMETVIYDDSITVV
jgi:flagellin-like protein